MAVFYIKMLSLMTITRERQSHHSGWQDHRRHHPRAGERSHTGLRDLYGGYTAGGRINVGRGLLPPFVIRIIPTPNRCGYYVFIYSQKGHSTYGHIHPKKTIRFHRYHCSNKYIWNDRDADISYCHSNQKSAHLRQFPL